MTGIVFMHCITYVSALRSSSLMFDVSSGNIITFPTILYVFFYLFGYNFLGKISTLDGRGTVYTNSFDFDLQPKAKMFLKSHKKCFFVYYLSLTL